jgi:hypothetical protein
LPVKGGIIFAVDGTRSLACLISKLWKARKIAGEATTSDIHANTPQ